MDYPVRIKDPMDGWIGIHNGYPNHLMEDMFYKTSLNSIHNWISYLTPIYFIHGNSSDVARLD